MTFKANGAQIACCEGGHDQHDDRSNHFVSQICGYDHTDFTGLRYISGMSRNKPTIEQLHIICRTVRELMKAGQTQNAAIRQLEEQSEWYARAHHFGMTNLPPISKLPLWSVAAREAYNADPTRRTDTYLRKEHGTPRRAFALLVLALWDDGQLTEASMNQLCDQRWEVAVITHEEDARMFREKLRSALMDTPRGRWDACDIIMQPFPET